MPNLSAHCAISKQRIGFNFAKLHGWIDHPPAAEILGQDHRIERHAYKMEDMETIKDYWERENVKGVVGTQKMFVRSKKPLQN